MKQHLLKNTYAAIVALFIGMMVLPTTAQAQSIAKQALKSSSGEMPITGNKIKTASAKASVSFPLLEGFESDEIPDGWTLIDANNDGRNWQVLSNEKTYWVRPKSGKCVIGSFSDDNKDLNPDNYLISPKISGATQLIYWFSLNTKYPDDRYQVLASTTGKDISDFTIVLKDEKPTDLKPIEEGENQSEWIKRTLQLPVGTKYIAFRHYDSNKSGEGNYILLDEITIDGEIINYALNIAGTQVTSANCDDLSVIDGVEGTVKYEPESKTLTLENATIKNTKKEDYSSIGLYNAIDGLAIRLIGNNTISVEYNSGIGNRDGNALTLTGNGKLTVKSLAETSRYSIFNEGTITVRNCTLEASGWVGGLTSGYWKFDHCTVRVKGGGDSEYEDLGSINRLLQKPEFIGCAVIAPAGTYWKECEGIVGELYYSLFGADDKVVTDWVTIADPTSIHTPIVDTNTKQGIYTLSGVKLNGEVEDLPKGIYIVNGKKVVKK